MAKKATLIPDLSNATPEFLVDEMGKLSMIENYAKKQKAFYKEALFAMMKIDPELVVNVPYVQAGETFIATITQSYPTRLDQTAFKDAEPETFDKYVKQGQQLTTRFNLAAGVDNPIIGSLIEQIKMELDLD